MQVLGFTSKTDISIKPYLKGKFLQGLISSIYTYLLYKLLFFNKTVSTFSTTIYDVINEGSQKSISFSNFYWCIIVGILFVFGFIFLKNPTKTELTNKRNYKENINYKNNSIKIKIR